MQGQPSKGSGNFSNNEDKKTVVYNKNFSNKNNAFPNELLQNSAITIVKSNYNKNLFSNNNNMFNNQNNINVNNFQNSNSFNNNNNFNNNNFNNNNFNNSFNNNNFNNNFNNNNFNNNYFNNMGAGMMNNCNNNQIMQYNQQNNNNNFSMNNNNNFYNNMNQQQIISVMDEKQKLEYQKKSQEENQIRDYLKCNICLGKVLNPRMCKYCNKICCEECIKKWFENRDYCGMCKRKCSLDDMTPVPVIGDMVAYFINNIDNHPKQNINDINYGKLDLYNNNMNFNMNNNYNSMGNMNNMNNNMNMLMNNMNNNMNMLMSNMNNNMNMLMNNNNMNMNNNMNNMYNNMNSMNNNMNNNNMNNMNNMNNNMNNNNMNNMNNMCMSMKNISMNNMNNNMNMNNMNNNMNISMNNMNMLMGNMSNNNNNMNMNNMVDNINNNMRNNMINNMNNNVRNKNMSAPIDSSNMCPNHNYPYQYYCVQCNQNYCNSCLVFFNNEVSKHQNHIIIPINQMNNTVIKGAINEYKKLENTKNTVDDLIGQCNFKVKENDIKKCEIKTYFQTIREDFLNKINNNSKEINEILNSLKNQKDTIDRYIDSIPTAFSNAVHRQDYNQGDIFCQELKKVNKIDENIEQEIIKKSKINPKLIYETYYSDYIEFKIPNENQISEGLEIFNKNFDFIKGHPCHLTLTYIDNKIMFTLAINIEQNLKDMVKFYSCIIMRNKKYGVEFVNLSNQIDNSNSQQINTIDFQLPQFVSLKNEKGEIKLRILVIKTRYEN